MINCTMSVLHNHSRVASVQTVGTGQSYDAVTKKNKMY